MSKCDFCQKEKNEYHNVVKVTKDDGTPLEAKVCNDCYDFIIGADAELDGLARLGFLLFVKRKLEKRLGVKLQ